MMKTGNLIMPIIQYPTKVMQLILINVSVFYATHLVAAGTTSGTNISNQATLNYEVDGVTQASINSNTVSFQVDAKVDLTVTGTNNVNGTPGTVNVLEFTVTNTGNETYDYQLSFEAGAETFTVSDWSIHLDTNHNGIWDGITVDLPGTVLDNLAADASAKVWLVGTLPTTATDNQSSTYHLIASARREDGSAIPAQTADIATSKQYVYADAAGPHSADNTRDAQHSAALDLIAQTASLSITKSSSVIWDPVNLNNFPLHIPGAIVEYTLTITNAAGAETASAIVITDVLDTHLAPPTDTTRQYAPGHSIRLSAPNLYSGAMTPLTDANDSDEANITGQTVTVSGITLLGGESATIQILAEIQ